MPSPNPSIRREYAGNAAATTLSTAITDGTVTSFVITSAANWPTGGTGKFTVTVDRGQATEERILCLSRTGTTVTVDTRGYDSTTAQAHALNATVECTLSAAEANEWNAHTNATAAVHGAAGTVVGTSDSQTLTNKTMSGAANTFSNIPQSASHTSPDTDAATSSLHHTLGTGATQAAAGTHTHTDPTNLTDSGWTPYTPVWTGASTDPVIGNGTLSSRYKQIGKTVIWRVKVVAGSTTTFGTGNWGLSVPVTAISEATLMVGVACEGRDDSAATNYLGFARLADTTHVNVINGTGSAVIWDSLTPFTWASGDFLRFTLVYEAA